MDEKRLNEIEIDAIGEILNISLGSAATAVSNMLNARVDITTPIVRVREKKNFEFADLEPAVGIEIANQAGLTGSNVMILKRSDVCSIVSMLMGMEMPDDEFELNEINSSAIGEVMNQMMGASATALSELLERTVDISTPVVFPIPNADAFRDKYFGDQEIMVETAFQLSIGDRVESEFIYLLPMQLSKELVSGFFKDGMAHMMEQDDTPALDLGTPPPVASSLADTTVAEPAPQPVAEPAPQPVVEPAPQPVAEPAPQPVVEPAPQPVAEPAPQPVAQPVAAMPVAGMEQFAGAMTQMMEMMQKQMEMTQMQMNQMSSEVAQVSQAVANAPQKINTAAPIRPNLAKPQGGAGYDNNMDMVMGVPVEVSVEIGRTKKLVKDILDLNKGSLVVLDKLAGEQVDLFVNGQCIAYGDVVVVDDNFGIRITQILDNDITISE